MVKHAQMLTGLAGEEISVTPNEDVALDFAQSVAHTFTKVYDDIVQLRPAAAAATRANSVITDASSDTNGSSSDTQQQKLHKTSQQRRRRSASAMPFRPRIVTNTIPFDYTGQPNSSRNGIASRTPPGLSVKNQQQYDANAPVHERLFSTRKDYRINSSASKRSESSRNSSISNGSSVPSVSSSPTNDNATTKPFSPRINESSRQRTRDCSVADDLLRWQQRHDAKMEKQREILERQVLGELKSGPEINKRSASIMARNANRNGRRKVALADRAAEYQRTSANKQEVLRRALQVKENATLQDAPVINKQSNQMVKQRRSVQDRMAWQVDRDAKIARQRQLADEMQTAKLNFSPRISGGSRRIAERLTRPGQVGERLHNKHHENLQKREQQLVQQTQQQRQLQQNVVKKTPSPKPRLENDRVFKQDEPVRADVQEHSHNLPRGAGLDVADRLYGIAIQRMRDRQTTPVKHFQHNRATNQINRVPLTTPDQRFVGGSNCRGASKSNHFPTPGQQHVDNNSNHTRNLRSDLVGNSRETGNLNQGRTRRGVRQPSPTPIRVAAFPGSSPPPPPPPRVLPSSESEKYTPYSPQIGRNGRMKQERQQPTQQQQQIRQQRQQQLNQQQQRQQLQHYRRQQQQQQPLRRVGDQAVESTSVEENSRTSQPHRHAPRASTPPRSHPLAISRTSRVSTSTIKHGSEEAAHTHSTCNQFLEGSSPKQNDRLVRGTPLVYNSERARGSNTLVDTFDSVATVSVVPRVDGGRSALDEGVVENNVLNRSSDDAFLFAAGREFVHASAVVAKYAGLNLQ